MKGQIAPFNFVMPLACALGLLTLAPTWTRATDTESGVEIVSPSHPETLNVCECPKMTQRLSWDTKAGMLRGKIIYSSVPGVAIQGKSAAESVTFVLDFPSVHRDARGELYVEDASRELMIGRLKKADDGKMTVQTNPGVGFLAHRVEGRLGGEIIVSPAACTVVSH